MMFGRKKSKDAAPASRDATTEDAVNETSERATDEATQGAAPDGAAAASSGPQDRGAVPEVSHLVDLGSLHALPGPGMDLRVEVDNTTSEVSAIQMGDDEGAVQVQVFAAPRKSGIWDDIRAEIAEMIRGNGGTVEEAEGPFGDELRTRLAQPGPQGRTVFAPAIFAGVDGPRWFLRAVYSGAPAIDESARVPYDDCLRALVVTRGDEPRAPREMLPLSLPTTESEPDNESEEQETPEGHLKPFERGPEITEVR